MANSKLESAAIVACFPGGFGLLLPMKLGEGLIYNPGYWCISAFTI